MDDYKFPRSEEPVTDLCDKDGNLVFVITENKMRKIYYLYSVSGKNIEKLGKGDSPTELEIRFKTKEKMGCRF